MKRADIDLFEKLEAQLEGFHQEILTLVKKSPNDAVNTFKLNFLNAILGQCNHLLGEKYKPFADFEVFSSDDMPSNSDVSFVVAQYIECVEKLRADNIEYKTGERGIYSWYWIIEDSQGLIHTASPKKLNKKN
jgi:hypothetical protein